MRPDASEIHLWTQSLAVSEAELQGFSACLSEDELERSRRFHFKIHRDRFIAARGRLRRILGPYVEVEAQALEFTYGPYGKPALAAGPKNVQFNTSHSNDLAVYAISLNRQVGIDVEKIRERFVEEGIPERFFSPAEVAQLRSLPKSQQEEAFFRCWTRKEAYVKARAEGLSIPLDSFDVSLKPGDPPRFLRRGEGFSIYSFQIEPDYIGAIVGEGHGWVVIQKE